MTDVLTQGKNMPLIASMEPVSVLNHGYVTLCDFMGDDLSVVRSARVSHDAVWRTGEDNDMDARLINYLVKNGHTSPLECVSFTFEVKCPIFVARQWFRHRTGKFNEVSGRYSELPEEFYIPEVSQITTQSTGNKQQRTDQIHPEAEHIQEDISAMCKHAHAMYKKLLQSGCPRELARGVLPLNTYTKFFFTMDLHNLAHFLHLRLSDHAQYEIRVYAEAILKLITPLVPVTMEALKRHGKL